MPVTPRSPLLLAAVAAATFAVPVAAQDYDNRITVTADAPASLEGLTEGPRLEGFVSARDRNRVQITSETGEVTEVVLSPATEIRAAGGFLGMRRTALTADQVPNGVPVTVETLTWGNGLVASSIRMKNGDLQTAAMIRNGTAQRFAEHDVAIAENAAATEALRGRFGDIDQYNIHGTTTVNFDTGRWNLTPSAEAELCRTAQQANAMDNALLLVVGYTDNVGDEDYNQVLSERRAGRVVNYLQQHCGWAPYRMLTPTGMSEAAPSADNSTPQGRAQNRRVTVNILVSKAVDGIGQDRVASSR